ncbi:MAG: glycosyltransferase family 4 protein, partial [Myxococcales bacterium]|nr:glycosyltransferase family 4 protein [Myxococcales bacterium]
AESRALIFPSTCYENGPLVPIEAFSVGTPVLGSDRGALTGVITDGVNGRLFNPLVASELQTVVRWARTADHDLERIGRAGRITFESQFSEARSTAKLQQIYRESIKNRRRHSA